MKQKDLKPQLKLWYLKQMSFSNFFFFNFCLKKLWVQIQIETQSIKI